ncbi:MAG: bifunctional nuclease family protein [Sedimentisphaerales bacterium]|nr:bifunctional nuclease family protein [Sedimentisphaerales bacterium]
MEVPVELSRILINEADDRQIIVLKEINGERSFPVVIGMPEILAIDRRLKGIDLPRPMTHDLLANTILEMGGQLKRVVINDLREHVFYAILEVVQNGRTIHIDSRPSDALALSAGLDVPIFVDEQVFEKMMM